LAHVFIYTPCSLSINGCIFKNMTISIRRGPRKNRRNIPSPIVVYANWFQFGASKRLVQPRVESRMLLSVHRGSGALNINGRTYPARCGSWFFLPWAHAIEYVADASDPFFVGGIHIIPDHAPGIPVRNRVAHGSGDALAGVPYRRDADLPCGRGLRQGSFEPGRGRLNALIHYLIESFQTERPEGNKQRRAAEWMLEEISINLKQAPSSGSEILSPSLFRLETYIRQNLNRPLTIPILAKVANCSVAGIHRMFQLVRKQTPAKWVAAQRTERAAHLLRTTSLSVQEVAKEVGIADPFQFSRFFKRHTGYSPRSYRQRQGIL
jgi:AraC-like DNA-binding protein